MKINHLGLLVRSIFPSGDDSFDEASSRLEKLLGDDDDEEAEVMRQVFWTGIAHSLQVNHITLFNSIGTLTVPQYPSEQHEQGRYWSGYDAKVHDGESYTGYSIWVCRSILAPSLNIETL